MADTSTLLQIRLPPGWRDQLDKLDAKLGGNGISWTVKEAIRLMVAANLGVDLQHRGRGEKEWDPPPSTPSKRKPIPKRKISPRKGGGARKK